MGRRIGSCTWPRLCSFETADTVRPLHPFADAWPADALLATEFPRTPLAVPGTVPEGLSMLAGPLKVGKSWMALGTAAAVASGGRALGSIPCEPGPVLYLALEDNPRRLQRRIRQILNGQPAPPGCTSPPSASRCPPGETTTSPDPAGVAAGT